MEAALNDKRGQKTQGLCLVCKTTPPRQIVSVVSMVLVLWGFLIPIINTTFIELSTAAYLKSLSVLVLS
jgi:hypothetical protein